MNIVIIGMVHKSKVEASAERKVDDQKHCNQSR